MSRTNDLYLSELEKSNELVTELLEALDSLSTAICKNTNGMPDWLSHAIDHANEAMRKARGEGA